MYPDVKAVAGLAALCHVIFWIEVFCGTGRCLLACRWGLCTFALLTATGKVCLR